MKWLFAEGIEGENLEYWQAIGFGWEFVNWGLRTFEKWLAMLSVSFFEYFFVKATHKHHIFGHKS